MTRLRGLDTVSDHTMGASTNALGDYLRTALEEYPVDDIGEGIEQTESYRAITEIIPDLIEDIIEVDGLKIKGSCGQGRLTSI
jgi:hypothetical protein